MAEAKSYKAGLLQWDASTLSLRLDLLGFVTSLRIKWLFDRTEDVDVGTSLPFASGGTRNMQAMRRYLLRTNFGGLINKAYRLYTYCLQRMAKGQIWLGKTLKS